MPSFKHQEERRRLGARRLLSFRVRGRPLDRGVPFLLRPGEGVTDPPLARELVKIRLASASLPPSLSTSPADRRSACSDTTRLRLPRISPSPENMGAEIPTRPTSSSPVVVQTLVDLIRRRDDLNSDQLRPNPAFAMSSLNSSKYRRNFRRSICASVTLEAAPRNSGIGRPLS